MLALLLDEHISHEIAEQITRKRPDLPVVSLREWENGRYMSADDETLLQAAAGAGLTLVTYDQSTIPPLLARFAEQNLSHGGILFVDQRTIPSNDFGGLVRALVWFWEEHHDQDWANRLAYLRPAA
jgi:Domain of unknown function (DUF5615)